MLQIGPYQFDNPLVLAPMAGITDAVFRQLCRENGAAYTLAEMVASKKELWESKKSSTRHVDLNDPEPRAIQLLGTNPDELAEAAAWQVSNGAQIIDLNMGCPAKKVCSVAAGSVLMGHPQTVDAIFTAVRTAVSVPVTVKIRTGLDADNKNALQIAQIAENAGLSAITIHGRTRADKFQGNAEYDTIAEVKQSTTLPVIANGDICSPEQAKFVLEYTNADGLMIGRASQGYPWLFREVNHYLTHGEKLAAPTSQEFVQTLSKHIAGLHNLYGETLGPRIARKHFGWYLEHLPAGLLEQLSTQAIDSKTLRRRFNLLNHQQEQLDLIEQFFASNAAI